jgi:acyl carrier protein
MIPVIFKRVENFIQTASGKIDRKRALECVEIKVEDLLTQDSDMARLSDIQKRAFDVIASNLDSKIGNVALESAFTGSGVDSITFITIVVALEGDFNFEFDDEKLLRTEFPTIKSMVEYVDSKVQ